MNKAEERKYVVKWESKISGRTGQGNPVNYETAEFLVSEGNKSFRDIHHWLEEIPLQK